MLIDKEVVRSAKESLGDQNFDLITESLVDQGLISLTDIDEKNKRIRCPFHAGDDTPSCVYDKKRLRLHCFGCQRDYDVIDAFKDSGMTYLEACQKLFEKANVQYAFSEKGLKTQSPDYVYPTLPSKDHNRSNVEQYWSKRGISLETLDYFDVREDEHGNSVFITYDLNDVATVVKYKPSHKPDKANGESKCWFQKGASKDDLLFNMNRINTTEPLLICEGEPDALTAKEAGYANVVTPLNGAGSFGWVERCWNFLEQFDSIILCSDNDDPGQKMRNELIYRLGSWRCKVVEIPTSVTWSDGKEYPVKDLNDMFHAYGKDAVLKAIINAKDTPVKSVVDFADVTELELSQMDGVETGLESLDAELYKLYYGTVTLISGAPAAGKSSLINSIIANAMEDGVKCWLFSKEMPVYITRAWLNLQLCGQRNIVKYEDAKNRVFWNVRPGIKPKLDQWARGKLYMYKDDESTEVDDIINSMTECTRKFGTKLLVIDNLMCVSLHNPEGELKAQKDFIVKLVGFAIRYNVAVILIAHPRKRPPGAPSEMDVSLQDISGSSDLGNMAHRSISLRRITEREREQNESKFAKYNVKITINKDRLLGRSADTAIGVYYDVPSRRFFTNYKEFARQYGWDQTVYKDKIPLPACLADEVKVQQEEEEVFGHV